MWCPKSRFLIQIIVFDKLELLFHIIQGLSLLTVSLVLFLMFGTDSNTYQTYKYIRNQLSFIRKYSSALPDILIVPLQYPSIISRIGSGPQILPIRRVHSAPISSRGNGKLIFMNTKMCLLLFQLTTDWVNVQHLGNVSGKIYRCCVSICQIQVGNCNKTAENIHYYCCKPYIE